jgi:integrase/recombinase XerD
MAVEHRLAPSTIDRNVYLVRPFLERFAAADGVELGRLDVEAITGFVLECRDARGRTAPRMVTALRSLLRFLHVDGLIDRPLVTAVPAIASWKLAGLPKALRPDDVAALLATCDEQTVVGRRDLAILTVLARLGLRAGEVAGLRLDDIDWRQGQLTVRGKGNRLDELPLPVDVGQIIVAYLRAEHPDSTPEFRELFARVRAPRGPLTRLAVTQIVAAAARRAGLPTIHAHRLRHTAASGMLRSGGSLTEIGQVLRHARPLTTAIYAKVDVEALRTLALPWPGGAA